MHTRAFLKFLPVLFVVLCLGAGIHYLTAQPPAAPDWTVAGHDLANSRSQPAEHMINTANVSSLGLKWIFTGGGGDDISATPIVTPSGIYVPDWSGKLYAVKPDDGSMLWTHSIADYDHYVGAISRVSPAIHNGALILGDLQSSKLPHNGANVVAVDRQTGNLLWITQVDSHPAAVVTGSPAVAGDVVFVGVSSTEESLATNQTYTCCSFRGSMAALDANTGKILWQTFTMPDNGGLPDGYSGGAIWQPPAIDTAKGVLYAGTGNNYEVPDSVKACVAASTPDRQPSCFAANDYYDSALALDMKTGRILWSKRLQGTDIWTVACSSNSNPMACPFPQSPDYDLSGSGPNLLANGTIVGFGQKSGIYWALKADTGDVAWSSIVGPGATLGGIEWGTATDGKQIYVAITNGEHKPYQLIDGTSTTGGAWSALDAATGKLVWQTADPDQAFALGAVSVANGIVYVPSFSGNMLALDANTGKVLFKFFSGGSVVDGPSIVNGTVYWGAGYHHLGGGMPNSKLFAFTVTRP
ncbi:MAG TPA: PQQ-binding-like beta-propeller repeat protein [Bryobacteraceae bacterium]|jgi:polyvinyl alcohol dehydrogenase (cytochrome)